MWGILPPPNQQCFPFFRWNHGGLSPQGPRTLVKLSRIFFSFPILRSHKRRCFSKNMAPYHHFSELKNIWNMFGTYISTGNPSLTSVYSSRSNWLMTSETPPEAELRFPNFFQTFQLRLRNAPKEVDQLSHLGVSKNSGTPKWMVYKGKP